jgi:uncharacterized membrane protein required for colicin V production
MLFDVILLAGIMIFTIIGYFKGFLSQFFTIIAIVAAYVLSPRGVPIIREFVRDLVPFSYVVDDMLSRLFVGIIIFIGVKICGKLVEYIFASKFRELGTINKWGGFLLGFAKAVLVTALVMTFVTIIPSKIIKKRFNFLENSFVYKTARKFNPIVNPRIMDDIRRLAELAKDEKKLAIINKSATYQDYLKTKNLSNPLENAQLLDYFEKGDLDGLKKAGAISYLEDKDFLDFIYGEKYYKQPEPAKP